MAIVFVLHLGKLNNALPHTPEVILILHSIAMHALVHVKHGNHAPHMQTPKSQLPSPLCVVPTLVAALKTFNCVIPFPQE